MGLDAAIAVKQMEMIHLTPPMNRNPDLELLTMPTPPPPTGSSMGYKLDLCNKSCQLMAALELGRRMISLQPEDRAVIRSLKDVYNLMSGEMSFFDQEHHL